MVSKANRFGSTPYPFAADEILRLRAQKDTFSMSQNSE
jgi:hypothetical protein